VHPFRGFLGSGLYPKQGNIDVSQRDLTDKISGCKVWKIVLDDRVHGDDYLCVVLRHQQKYRIHFA